MPEPPPKVLTAVVHHDARPTREGGMPEPAQHLHIASDELARRLSETSSQAAALAEAALAFCKECLDWKNAQYVNDWGYLYIREPVSRKLADTTIPPYERHFHYAHFDCVMEAVRQWLVAAGNTREHHMTAAARSMQEACSKYIAGALDQADLCRELMAACVQASRGRQGKPAHA